MASSAVIRDERVSKVEVDDNMLSVGLRDGRVITVPLFWFPRLLHATAEQRSRWSLAGAGYGIHWPDIDEDLSTEGLLRGAPSPEACIRIGPVEAVLEADIDRSKPRREMSWRLGSIVEQQNNSPAVLAHPA